MTDAAGIAALSEAVQRYFDLHYDSDLTRFSSVFCPTAQLHGLRDGRLAVLSARGYRDLMASRPSPRSQNAPRQDEILLVDFASLCQALVKLRLRVNATVYVDYLTYHRVEGTWLVTGKGFHVETTAA